MGFFDFLKTRPSKAVFAERVIAAHRGAGFDQPMEYDAEHFALSFGPTHKSYLANLYDEYCRLYPWQRSRILTLAVRASGETVMERPSDFMAARRMLAPALRGRFALEMPRQLALQHGEKWTADRSSLRLASTPLTEDYALVLVLDAPTTMAFVNEEQLKGWEVPVERAMAYALDNLRATSSPGRFELVAPGVFRSAWRDAYDVSRIAFPELVRALPVKGRPVVGVPNRDQLLVTGEDDDAGLEALARLIEQAMAGPRPLGAVPLVLDGDVWRTFEPRGSSAAAVALRNLTVRGRGTAYAEQKALLDAEHARDGTDLFVASFSARSGSEDPELHTYCTWARGVRSLLPRTEHVALVDPDRAEDARVFGLFPWAALAEHAGAYLQRQDTYPERWLVESFPTDEELARLAPHRLG